MSEEKPDNIYICWCGNTADHHNFRHAYTKTAKVIKKIKSATGKDIEEYKVFAAGFPEKTDVKCGYPQCSFPANLHTTANYSHPYQPENIVYRDIKFVMPENAICNICDMELSFHESLSHHFTTSVKIMNKSDHDKVSIIHPEDEDIRIVWKEK